MIYNDALSSTILPPYVPLFLVPLQQKNELRILLLKIILPHSELELAILRSKREDAVTELSCAN